MRGLSVGLGMKVVSFGLGLVDWSPGLRLGL